MKVELHEIREHDIIELGYRTAAWLAVGGNNPSFMLAGLALRDRRPLLEGSELLDILPVVEAKDSCETVTVQV